MYKAFENFAETVRSITMTAFKGALNICFQICLKFQKTHYISTIIFLSFLKVIMMKKCNTSYFGNACYLTKRAFNLNFVSCC